VNTWAVFFWVVTLCSRLETFWRDVDLVASIFRVEDHNPKVLSFMFFSLCRLTNSLRNKYAESRLHFNKILVSCHLLIIENNSCLGILIYSSYKHGVNMSAQAFINFNIN
jgi:hypothetical protein